MLSYVCVPGNHYTDYLLLENATHLDGCSHIIVLTFSLQAHYCAIVYQKTHRPL